jgi:hypothetical protein
VHTWDRLAARRHAADGAIALALAGAVWLLYGPVLRLWWMYDDVFHLHFLLTHRSWWYFFDASGFRDFPARLLTPLLFFSLDLDRRLSGFDPHPFYVHQLLALSLCTATLYGVLRLWLARLGSAIGAWIFLIGPVTASLASLLMVRHYIETVLLLALSVAAWAGAVQRSPGAGAWGRAGLSAALYFAACMAKEFAVPLFVLLPLLPPPGTRRPSFDERLRLALPHAAAFVVYLLLRHAVLGTLLGGYGFAVQPSGVPALALQLPGKIAAEFVAGQSSPAALVFACALAAGALSLFLTPHGRRAALLACLALLLAMLPFLPASTRMEPRKAAPAWIVLAVAIAAGCSTLASGESRTRRRAAYGIALAACAAGLWLNRQDWNVRFARAERMSAENRFLLEMQEGDVLRQPLTLAASLRELEWMKEEVFRRPRGGRWFQDDLYLCLHRGPLGRVWGYSSNARQMVDLTEQVPALRDRHCSTIRFKAPLHASFHFTGENLLWDLGPYREGTYRLVLDGGGQAFEVPRKAEFQARGQPPVLLLRVGYKSPDGWITYSPELRLLSVDGWSLRWSRP